GGLAIDTGGLLHPGKWFAGLLDLAEQAGAQLHEATHVSSIRRQADGRFVVETDRGAVNARDVLVATNGYTDGAAPSLRRRIIPIGSYIIATEPLDPAVARQVSPRGRMFFDSKNFLYYWRVLEDGRMMFGGRASMAPTTVARTRDILYRAMVEIHPQLRGTRVVRAWGGNVGFTFDRIPHAGRTGGIAYALGYCGTGVALSWHLGRRMGAWMAGDDPPPFVGLRFPIPPAGAASSRFLPAAGLYYRLRDRIG
ncbi:MAG: FAD-binding oxidoreductase, partial [Actinomycetota bacterium]|nr:FAD-binding oxidoreductase [Actinomycetota bacterium]